jgi:hypothetical protein
MYKYLQEGRQEASKEMVTMTVKVLTMKTKDLATTTMTTITTAGAN